MRDAQGEERKGMRKGVYQIVDLDVRSLIAEVRRLKAENARLEISIKEMASDSMGL